MYEVIKKPWGKEEILENNGLYVVKKLTMYKNNRCSLQYHEYKTETIFMLSGRLKIYIGEESDIFENSQSITIEPNTIHRMEAIEDSVYLEVSTCELNDVIRLNDDYNR